MNFKVGDKVAVDLGMPNSAWHRCEGFVTDPNYRGSTRVKLSRLGPKAAGLSLGAEYKLTNLTLMEFAPEQPAEAPVTPETGVGVSRYTKGMPEGVEARHIMSTQGWYEAFCKGSILKYITRLDHKGQYLSDLNKIKTYAEELIKLEEAK